MDMLLKITASLVIIAVSFSVGHYIGKNSDGFKKSETQIETEFNKLPRKFKLLVMEAGVDSYNYLKGKEENEKDHK